MRTKSILICALVLGMTQVARSEADTGAPADMALIPAGVFEMGDTFAEGRANELPVHRVYVSAFCLEQNLVTKALWDQVYRWAITHGYDFDNAGEGKAPSHPVHSINWYDMVKWCNARSESAGLKPCYFTEASHTAVYRTGQIDLTNSCVNWGADGYRLPTEAEWEKAARGGVAGHRYPWTETDTISHSRANYYSSSRYSYDESTTRGYNPRFYDGVVPFTSPVGSFAPNGHGLYDMAGNIWQWCWDVFDGNWYSQAGATQKDTRGPGLTRKVRAPRAMRGGSFHRFAFNARCADRDSDVPDFPFLVFGFRCARSR